MTGVLLFGLFNITTSSSALGASHDEPETTKDIADFIILKLLAETGPIVAAIMGLGFDFLRRRGIKISTDAEKYFTTSISTMVSRESKWIYEEMRDNKHTWTDPGNEDSTLLPKRLGEATKMNVITHLTAMLESKEFNKNSKEMLTNNLQELVEIAVSENNKVLTNRSKNLIRDLAPLAIDAILLTRENKEDMQGKSKDIVKEAIKKIKENFDFEEIPFDGNFADLFVRTQLKKKIDESEEKNSAQ